MKIQDNKKLRGINLLFSRAMTFALIGVAIGQIAGWDANTTSLIGAVSSPFIAKFLSTFFHIYL